MEPDASTPALLSYVLTKPLSYFFLECCKPDISIEEIDKLKKAILQQPRRVNEDDLQRFVAQWRQSQTYRTIYQNKETSRNTTRSQLQ